MITNTSREGDAMGNDEIIQIADECFRLIVGNKKIRVRRSDIDDLYQETMLTLSRLLGRNLQDKIKENKNARGYIYRIVYNAMLKHASRVLWRQQQREILVDNSDETLANREFRENMSIGDVLNVLPAGYRNALYSIYFLGLSVQEYADSVGQTAENIRYKLKKAIGMLRKRLNEEE